MARQHGHTTAVRTKFQAAAHLRVTCNHRVPSLSRTPSHSPQTSFTIDASRPHSSQDQRSTLYLNPTANTQKEQERRTEAHTRRTIELAR
ncbi:hypothetical protein SNOG_04133 [Parastagonospora nodorum SN15]|uniref:Uncharacterized protein n=1 Tax=Phaeosphaeria nodorum (strain SN15 / ATCC MYA-4574 / FGSC 10173) TaxID=321614 RepID=Q0UVT1_PHANO|nr:hypothetical protein SNOG_04133 [Parastagonospora nodorum SN15]EAT87893.1 hypothetical protein SNOG_04133 [Parastagonospora nodorum SN15]